MREAAGGWGVSLAKEYTDAITRAAGFLQLDADEVLAGSRLWKNVACRRVVFHYLKHYGRSEVARLTGADHTTIIAHVKKKLTRREQNCLDYLNGVYSPRPMPVVQSKPGPRVKPEPKILTARDEAVELARGLIAREDPMGSRFTVKTVGVRGEKYRVEFISRDNWGDASWELYSIDKTFFDTPCEVLK